MRKFRKTEISGTSNVLSGGQHMHANWFCLNCHCVASKEKHYPDCKNPDAYTIPATAEVPRKNANKRVWDIFKKQFVFVKPNGYWHFSEHCWWEKNKKSKNGK